VSISTQISPERCRELRSRFPHITCVFLGACHVIRSSGILIQFCKFCPQSGMNLTIVSLLLLVVNISIHVIIFLTSTPLYVFSIAAAPVLYQGEYYRVLSNAFVHAGLMHIGFNMMALTALAPRLEEKFGSLPLLFMTMWSIVVEGLLYIFVSYVMGVYITGDNTWLMHSGVGFSGVLFAYMILESYHTVEQSRSVFGMCAVPTKLYPWIMLVLLSLLIPGISFMGHLCGIVSGMLFVSGIMDTVAMPSPSFMRHIEDYACLRILTRLPNYSRAADFTFKSLDSDAGLGGTIFTAILYICYVIEAALGVCGCRVNLSGNLHRWNFGTALTACWTTIHNGFGQLLGHANTNGVVESLPPWARSGNTYRTLNGNGSGAPDSSVDLEQG